ncbi:MAG: AsnC family transcriptional regulator [Candidatus Micrarchaeota archaeon]|nr:AsnC family transcriptional regulator [Candidatus Micrarchaeota archaeon]
MPLLDKKDREILFQLDLNARQPNSAIARKVRASKEVVAYRIKRMEEAGVIDGYYVLVDITKLGYLHARIFLKLKNTSPTDEEGVLQYFQSESRCWWVNSISGSLADVGVAFWVKDINDFASFKKKFLSKYGKIIEFWNESIYSSIYIWRRNYLSASQSNKKQDLILGNSKKIEFDSHDIDILSSLTEDGKMPLIELAKKIGLSPTAIKNRMKRLAMEGALLGFRPKINLSKIGFYWYKVEFKLEDTSKLEAMLAYFASHPNIVYAYESIGGGAELEMEMEVESHEKFRQIVQDIRTKFSGAIRTYFYFLWSAEHKLVFFPPKEFFLSESKAE